MKKRSLIILFIVIISSLIGCTENEIKSISIKNTQLTQNEKVIDFEYMYNILKDNYPYFEVNKRKNGPDWLANKDEYINEIKNTKTDMDFFNTLNNILLSLNNRHTGMLNKNMFFETKTIYEQNEAEFSTWVKQFNNPKALNRYSKMTDEKNDTTISKNSSKSNNVRTDIIVPRKIAYLDIHSFSFLCIKDDMNIIKPFLNNIKDYKALIIDIRGNTGGDSRYWSDNIVPMLSNKPLCLKEFEAYRGGDYVGQFLKYGYKNLEPISSIDKENLTNIPPELKSQFKYYDEDLIQTEPNDYIGFKGKIYLLIDKYVFSSAEKFAAFSKITGFATLVGQRTGGDGIGGDPAFCVLPNSGYVFAFPKEMGLNPDGSCNFEYGTAPDITVVSQKNSDYTKDDAIQTILKLID